MNHSNLVGEHTQSSVAVHQPKFSQLMPWDGLESASDASPDLERQIAQYQRPVRAVVIDDDIAARRWIAHQLEYDQRVQVCGSACSVSSALKLIQNTVFDVMVVDFHLGDGTAIDVITRLKQVSPRTEALVLSCMGDDDCVIDAIRAGATGYLLKGSSGLQVADAIVQVVQGGAPINPVIARRLLTRNFGNSEHTVQSTTGNADQLSVREKEILRMVSHGLTSAEIAQRLGISAQTVNTHVKNVYRKLQVKTRAQAISSAMRHGWL
jgi:DNA-binding NarL/FixJ family response regulator